MAVHGVRERLIKLQLVHLLAGRRLRCFQPGVCCAAIIWNVAFVKQVTLMEHYSESQCHQ